ncbi:ABC transporter substrate-binding protein [Cohnella fermenti]|uniref:Extracellular solute-binding protein n=1 Tax=Cohnella fermenti TaxID=2565925 RepID=A0A4S4BNY6_9BACL|nr:extracellular solute-binding protein [Cohnella fermenti]THF76558.1 extracellular solute-binding protein [Cohnella fermenti]
MKRQSFILLSAICLSLTMSACSNSANNNQTSGVSPSPSSAGTSASQEGSASPDAEPQTLTMVYSQGEFSWPAYEKMAEAFKEKTGHTVKLQYVPAAEFDKYLDAQFIAGTEADIIMGGPSDKSSWFKNGWIVNLYPHMDEASRFTNAAWRDSFVDGVLESATDKTPPEKLYGIPIQLTTVNLYYNKTIFNEIGAAEPPKTITELLEVAKKAEDAGYVGFSIQNSMDWNLGWLATDLWGYLWKPKLEQLDVINQDGYVGTDEWALAVKKGMVTKDSPELKEYARVLKDLSPYFNEGFNTASWEFESLFNDGKSAMALNGSWYPNQALQNNLTVDYGIAPIPYLDKTYSQLGGEERYNYIMGGEAYVAITAKAEKDGKLQAALDWLRFWTDPNGGAKMMTDELFLIPVVKGIQAPEQVQPIIDTFGTEKQVSFNAFKFEPEQSDAFFKAQQQYLDNKLTADAFIGDITKTLEKYADAAIKANPEWGVEALIERK